MGTIETPPGTIQPEDAKAILERLEKIEKKLSDKWVNTVTLAVLTAVIGLIIWFLQQSFLNSNLVESSLKKGKGEHAATSLSKFYIEVKAKLDSIDTNFESYCTVSQQPETDADISGISIRLVDIVGKQFPVDKKTNSGVIRYNDFVQFKLMEYSTALPSKDVLQNDYKKSKQHYDSVIQVMSDAMSDRF